MVKGWVPSSWIMYIAVEQSSGYPTAPVVVLVYTTAVTLRMLEWCAQVRFRFYCRFQH